MSISSEVGIYNLALNAIGERSNVSSPTENSRRAEVCRLWYEPVVDQILAGAPWPEATKISYLALVQEREDEDWVETDPRPGYSYVYALPTDSVQPQYLTDFSRFLISYYGDNQRVLHTNTEDAALAYTARITNVSLWGPQLRMAVVYALAANICMPLTGKPQRAKLLIEKANELLYMARETAANASTEQFEHIPEWIAARGYNYSSPERYIYPVGSLLTVSSVA